MKIPIRSTLGLLSFFATVTNAANCSPVDREPWSQTAVNLMWSLRQAWCSGPWWANIKVVPSGDWCDGSHCYSGWWYGHNHPSQQACWVSIYLNLLTPAHQYHTYYLQKKTYFFAVHCF